MRGVASQRTAALAAYHDGQAAAVIFYAAFLLHNQLLFKYAALNTTYVT